MVPTVRVRTLGSAVGFASLSVFTLVASAGAVSQRDDDVVEAARVAVAAEFDAIERTRSVERTDVREELRERVRAADEKRAQLSSTRTRLPAIAPNRRKLEADLGSHERDAEVGDCRRRDGRRGSFSSDSTTRSVTRTGMWCSRESDSASPFPSGSP